MNYLKTYEAWDSISSNSYSNKIDSELRETIIDIVKSECDLEEINYLVDFCNYNKNGIDYPAMSLYFRDRRNRFFKIKYFKETLLRIKDVCEIYNYNIDTEIPSEDETQMTFDEFLENFEHDELFRMRITIYKSYLNESFEDRESRFKRYDLITDTVRTVNDIFLELEDEGYDIRVNAKSKNLVADSIDIQLHFKDIKKDCVEYIERVNDYMESKKVFKKPEIWINYRDNKNYIAHGRPVSDMKSLLEYFDYDITIGIIKLTFTIFKLNESLESSKDDLECIFLELEDEGFIVKYGETSDKDPKSKYCEILIHNNKEKFRISEVSDVINRSIDYMEDFSSVIKYEERRWLSPIIKSEMLSDIEYKDVYRITITFYKPNDNFHAIWVSKDDRKIWGVLKPDFKTREESIKYIEGAYISRNDIVKTFISDEEYWLKEAH